ncbi:MAG: citrulline utilization hydrolase CtlX [Woeseiaceae bacterium]
MAAVENESQLASSVLMIRPTRFASNPMTALSNRFQGKSDKTPEEQNASAQQEFDALASALREAGVNVVVVEDTAEPHTPDSIFPNNWVSFHADGRVVLYAMEAENRRTERRQDILQGLGAEFGFVITEVIDLSGHETAGHYLEGTGSLVLDRVNRIAYACLSSRTQLNPLGDFAQRMDYEVLAFDALDRNGTPIYHTNVMMNVGERIAVICADAIQREDQRAAVVESLADTDREILFLSLAQLEAFAGNMLELRDNRGDRLVAMSRQAHDSLDEAQLALLQANGRIVTADISTIEASAGGSVRCMLAEIHLPTAAQS